LKELSVFIDESGDFGSYEPHAPFYLVTLVFHDQSFDITPYIDGLRTNMSLRGLPDYTVHAGTLIRREKEYKNFSIIERKAIFNNLFYFVRNVNISYHTVVVEKRELRKGIDLNIRITKQLSTFLNNHILDFMSYDRIVVYYDYGQKELTNIIVTAFTTVLKNVEFSKVNQSDYKLSQAADMFCTLELLAIKVENKTLSKSELEFFNSARSLKKSYLGVLKKKKFSQFNN
jgi:hypothetical protein